MRTRGEGVKISWNCTCLLTKGLRWFIVDQILIRLSRTRRSFALLLLFPILRPFFGRPFKKDFNNTNPARARARGGKLFGRNRGWDKTQGREGWEEWEITRRDICRHTAFRLLWHCTVWEGKIQNIQWEVKLIWIWRSNWCVFNGASVVGKNRRS